MSSGLRTVARRLTTRSIALALFASGFVAIISSSPPPAYAVSYEASTPSCGGVEFPTAAPVWGSGSWQFPGGVDVFSNGPADEGTTASCGGTNHFDGVETGDEYQCMEFINRLYVSEGWISGGNASTPSWVGDAGQPAWNDAPSNLSKQANGDVSYLGPGDVVDVDVYDNGVFEEGHALVVNVASDVTSGTVDLVSQNSGAPTSGDIPSNSEPVVPGTLSDGSVSVGGGGDGWTYSTIGVIHAPSIASSFPPPDGTFVQLQGSPNIYVIAGGAPLYVSTWAVYGGPQPFEVLDQSEWNELNAVPANGTFINAKTGSGQEEGAFVIAGGAPLYISTWSVYTDPAPAVQVDDWDLTNIGNSLDHLNAVPTNGTFLSTNTGVLYRVGGGYPFRIADCRVIGGCEKEVFIDAWDIVHAGLRSTHLDRAPANGTIVRSQPSTEEWRFESGHREQIKGAAVLTTVDDSSLSHIPKWPASVKIVTSTLPPATRGQVYRVALSAQGSSPSYKWTRTSGTMPPGIQLTTSGVMEGKPTESGKYSFTVQVESSNGDRAHKSFGVAVEP